MFACRYANMFCIGCSVNPMGNGLHGIFFLFQGQKIDEIVTELAMLQSSPCPIYSSLNFRNQIIPWYPIEVAFGY